MKMSMVPESQVLFAAPSRRQKTGVCAALPLITYAFVAKERTETTSLCCNNACDNGGSRQQRGHPDDDPVATRACAILGPAVVAGQYHHR